MFLRPLEEVGAGSQVVKASGLQSLIAGSIPARLSTFHHHSNIGCLVL